MKIILVKVEKALSVNRKYCKGMQPFTKTVKNLLFEFDKLNTCLSKFHMLLLNPELLYVLKLLYVFQTLTGLGALHTLSNFAFCCSKINKVVS